MIFCTAFDQYAVDAFELSAIDYLLKPVNRARLAAALDRVRSTVQPRGRDRALDELSHATGLSPTRFLARRGARFRVVPVQEVVAFTFVDGVTHVITLTEQLTMQPTLAALARRLDGGDVLPGVAHGDHPARCGARSQAVCRRHRRDHAGQRHDHAGGAAAVAGADREARGVRARCARGLGARALVGLGARAWRSRLALGLRLRACGARTPLVDSRTDRLYNPRMISRRDLFAQLAMAGVVARLAPESLFAQAPSAAQRYGKEKLLVRSLRPPDFETPVALLDSFITPNDLFYVRSHLPVPAQLDAATWALKVGGEVNSPLSLSIDEIKKLPAVTVTVTLECAGNGRAFFEPAVAGIQWEKGAVSTARFTGARLADVLKRAGVKTTGKNVEMHAADRPLGTMPAFVRQVPMLKAMHPDTILAYDMNGQPIPAVHGFPLRAIVPGWEGAYSVKWLNALNVLDKDSDSFWVATGYRYPNRRVAPGAAVDAKDMLPLTGLVVKSLITTPAAGASFAPGKITVGGFAWAGETDITKVDISIDNGATWAPARLVGEQAKYTWRRFEHTFTVSSPQSVLILSRATDSKGVVQPAVSQWNPSGYLWNQYDSVRVEVKGA